MKNILITLLLFLFSFWICFAEDETPLPDVAPQITPTPVEIFTMVEDEEGNLVKHCLIKGNINSRKEKIYHCPMWRDYGKTKIDEKKGERWFCTEAEAIAAGWRPPLYGTGPCR